MKFPILAEQEWLVLIRCDVSVARFYVITVSDTLLSYSVGPCKSR